MKLIEGTSAEKKQNLEKLLGFGTIMVFVDARKTGVEVPEQHRGNAQLPLNLDYTFQIPDFKVCDDRIEASLSFSRQRYFCVIPFDAIYAVSSKAVNEALVYPENLPPDISLFEAPSEPGTTTTELNPVKGPKLTVVSTSDNTPPAVTKEPTEAKPKKNHLKLVE